MSRTGGQVTSHTAPMSYWGSFRHFLLLLLSSSVHLHPGPWRHKDADSSVLSLFTISATLFFSGTFYRKGRAHNLIILWLECTEAVVRRWERLKTSLVWKPQHSGRVFPLPRSGFPYSLTPEPSSCGSGNGRKARFLSTLFAHWHSLTTSWDA